jgi:hypothetical protein
MVFLLFIDKLVIGNSGFTLKELFFLGFGWAGRTIARTLPRTVRGITPKKIFSN